MKYVLALFIKLVMLTVVLWIILGGFFGVSFINILATSAIFLGIAFIAGDLLILPKVGNGWSTIADFGLAWLAFWLLGFWLFEQPVSLGAAAFSSAVGYAIWEIFFHNYMQKYVLIGSSSRHENKDLSPKNLQTEFGSDMDAKPITKKRKK